MFPDIVQSTMPVTLVGGGELAAQDLGAALVRAPFMVAADGGANVAVEAGFVPDAVIGDMDSVRPEVLAAIPPERVHLIAEQETTDFEKCLSRIAAPYVLGLGFTGARVDHLLAVWNALVRHVARRCLILGPRDVAFAAPRELHLDLASGTRLSLFPMRGLTARGEGLAWPVEGLDFDPAGRVGTSNQATGPVRLCFSDEGMLVILPRSALDAAIAALR